MKIGCVLLAAGNAAGSAPSCRYRWTGNLSSAGRWRLSPAVLVTVVVSQYLEILSLAGEYGFEAVLNDQPDLAGAAASVWSGMTSTDWVAGSVLVADQPWLKWDSAEALAALWAQNPAWKIGCHGPRRCPWQSPPLPYRFYLGALALNGDGAAAPSSATTRPTSFC